MGSEWAVKYCARYAGSICSIEVSEEENDVDIGRLIVVSKQYFSHTHTCIFLEQRYMRSKRERHEYRSRSKVDEKEKEKQAYDTKSSYTKL